MKSKILVVYDGERVRDVVEAACSSSDVDCTEDSDFLNVVDIHKLDLNKLGIKYSLRTYAAAALGARTCFKQTTMTTGRLIWSRSGYQPTMIYSKKEGKVVEIHAVPQLARIENEGSRLMKFSGTTWDPKQGNPGVGLQTIAFQPPFGYMSLGLEDQEHRMMMDAPDADTMMACKSRVGTGFCSETHGTNDSYSASCQYCQHHGINAQTNMMVGVNLKRSAEESSGHDVDYNLWNHKEERLKLIPSSKKQLCPRK